MSIKVRLIFAMAMLLGLMGSQAAITISQVNRVVETSTRLVTGSLSQVEAATHINADLLYLRALELSLVLPGSPVPPDLRETTRELLANIEENLTNYRKSALDQDFLKELESFALLYRQYLDANRQLNDLAEAGRQEEALRAFQAAQPLFNSLLDQIHTLRHQQFDQVQKNSELAFQMASRTRYLFSFALLAVSLVELGIGWFLARSITSRLSAMAAATRLVSQGNFSHPVEVGSGDEFSELARSFNIMVSSLRRAKEENTQLHQEALHMHEQHIALLRERLTQVVRAQEDERRRIARELHDQAGQALTALQLALSHMEKAAPDGEWRRSAASLRKLTVDTMNDIRNLALDLRPSMLDELGLVPALRYYTRDWSKRFGVPVEFRAAGLKERLPSEIEIALFRVVQEALTNVAKHAGAHLVGVTLKASGEGLRVEVEDDGRGFDVETALQAAGKKSLGLFGMQERISLIGGSLNLNSGEGCGTRLSIYLPAWQANQEGLPYPQEDLSP